MKYDFDQVIDRSTNRSSKYDERMKKFGTMDVIPLWVADMDFKTAQPIIDALKKKAEEGIWGYTSVQTVILRQSAPGRSGGMDGRLIRNLQAGVWAWFLLLQELCKCSPSLETRF